MLKGITIQLYERVEAGRDKFGAPIYTEVPVNVDNVLVGYPDSREVLDTLSLTGRKAVYELGIPKGDMHEWENKRVGFFGKLFRVIGEPIEGIEEMIPLSWNKKVKVERYGGDEDQAQL